MKRFLSLSMALILLSACSNNAVEVSTKPEKYKSQKNSYWSKCKYQDVIKELLDMKLEMRLVSAGMDKDDMSKEFLDKYDPAYTSVEILKKLEEEVQSMIRVMARVEVLYIKSDTVSVKIDTVKTVSDTVLVNK